MLPQLLTPLLVPPATTARRAIHILQLPRVREATNERCIPGTQDGRGLAQGPGAGAERIERLAGHEGASAMLAQTAPVLTNGIATNRHRTVLPNGSAGS